MTTLEQSISGGSRGGDLRVRPVSDAIGAEVLDVDLAAMDDALFEQIHAAWMDHCVLLFRNQVNMTDDALVAFSRRVGTLDQAPPNENGKRFVSGYPEILVISNVVENGVALGSLGAGESVWHTDMNYIDEPPTASLLWGMEVPETGGDTGFLNMYKALLDLPADLRARIKGRMIKHDSSTNSAGYLREGAEEVTDVTVCPGAVHPIIRTHPVTGRKALYLGRRRNAYVVGLPLDESEELLDALWAHTAQEKYYWHHKWQVGDVVMWDNRCAMHRRDPFAASARRVKHRTQIKGTKPV
ncbi:MAG: TauD/TfdA family dioxygenase [Rhodospirillales bacterium]